MAWWNQPEGAVTPTVTLRRLAAWLAERGHSYDIDLSEGLVRFSVAGLDHVLMVVDRRILAVPALYTEVDDAGVGLCAEALANIGAGLDGAQLAGTMDFILEGIDGALCEVMGLLDAHAASQSDVGPNVEPDAEVKSDGSGGSMIAPVDADGGSGVETTDTPEPLLVP